MLHHLTHNKSFDSIWSNFTNVFRKIKIKEKDIGGFSQLPVHKEYCKFWCGHDLTFDNQHVCKVRPCLVSKLVWWRGRDQNYLGEKIRRLTGCIRLWLNNCFLFSSGGDFVSQPETNLVTSFASILSVYLDGPHLPRSLDPFLFLVTTVLSPLLDTPYPTKQT